MAKKTQLNCVVCGRDITRSMKIYPYGFIGGAYCYDCAEKERQKKPPIKRSHGRGEKQ